jgi:alpha-L-rhamnosidase
MEGERMSVSTLVRIGAFALIMIVCAPSASPAHPASESSARTADVWISHPAATSQARPIVLHFRRTFELESLARSYPVHVTADNRFILYINGKRAGSGPSTGDVGHWRYSSLDLAPYLKRGKNVLTAVVWNAAKNPLTVPAGATKEQRQAIMAANFMGEIAPLFQQSVATGFRLEGFGAAASLSTSLPGWLTQVDRGRTMTNGQLQRAPGYYVAGAPERIDAATAVWDASNAETQGPDWLEPVPAPAAAQRSLVADRLPAQEYAPVDPGKVVRTDLERGRFFPTRAVTVGPNRHVKLLIRRDAMVSAYPVLRTSGGRGATVKLMYAEALYDAKGKKADRDVIEDRQPRGIFDTFLPDGRPREFAPLWWRTWRFLEIDVTTGADPLRLEELSVFETGYPFRQVGQFRSDDPELNRIWDIGWRTARVDAHETYMDSAYWEQLQYVGDTRLQMLISYAVSGDPRLAEQAIDAFAASNGDGGLTQGAYPSRSDNVIPPFSLLWIGMLDDWRMQQPDATVVVRNIPRMREILQWFERWLSPRGLLTKNPQWNFIDWVGQTAADRTVFPSYSAGEGESCLTSAVYLGALQQAAVIEGSLGDASVSQTNAAAAGRLRDAIRKFCWSPDRALFADNPDKRVFSQHMNALAVLYDVVPAAEAPALLDRIVAPGKGIDAPGGMYTTSYYFAWYLIRAFEHAGRTDRYLPLLKTWRDLLAFNYTTWPEERGNTRSDTHAWSAHPTADLLGIVAGIQSASPGFRAVRVKPALGHLKALDAVAATPAGPVRVKYRVGRDKLVATIEKPASLPGTFEWGTARLKLTGSHDEFVIPVSHR